MLPIVLVASEAAKQKQARPVDYFDFIGCFADDNGAHDIDGWELAEARGKMDTRRCAETCATSAYFALQDGKCQCAAKFGLSPKVSKTEPEACGPVCPGEEGLSPLRRCGLAGRNAVWAHSTCLLGAAFELASTLSPAEGMVQFKAGILISSAIAAITAAQLTTLSTWSPSPPPMPPLPPPPPGVVNLQTATGHSLLSSCAAGCRERCDIEETTS